MKTITSANANRGFSGLLREVLKGEEFTILSRGTPVAKITSIHKEAVHREAMKKHLLKRLRTQEVTGIRNWSRDELYDD